MATTVYIVRRYVFRNAGSKQLLHPPGPASLPVLGSIMDLPKPGEPEFRHWLRHRSLYGPISSLTVLGRMYVLIHDQQLAHEILVKDAAKSSQRPWAEFAFSMCGLSEFMAVHYDADFRFRRKLMHQQLGTAKLVSRFDDIQDAEARRFLLRVLNSPDATIEHLKQYV